MKNGFDCKKTVVLHQQKREWQESVSTNNIYPESNIEVMRMKEMIEKSRSSWLLDKSSLYITWEMY